MFMEQKVSLSIIFPCSEHFHTFSPVLESLSLKILSYLLYSPIYANSSVSILNITFSVHVLVPPIPQEQMVSYLFLRNLKLDSVMTPDLFCHDYMPCLLDGKTLESREMALSIFLSPALNLLSP